MKPGIHDFAYPGFQARQATPRRPSALRSFNQVGCIEGALAYLNAAFEDEDERVFLLALKNVLSAFKLKR